MGDITGDFEIHLTTSGMAFRVDRSSGETQFIETSGEVGAFAAKHGLKFSDIVLDRGDSPEQPMVTVQASGPLEQVEQVSREWTDRMRAEHSAPVRVKIEAAPWNQGVPEHDSDAAGQRYFEHHVKLLLPDATAGTLIPLTRLLQPHQARLSRNARRQRDDGRHERFVTQRCHQAGRITAKARLDRLLAALSDHEILEVEEEYVVLDSNLRLDRGWLEEVKPAANPYEDNARTAPAGLEGYPPTYLPVPDNGSIQQRAAFDPALKHYSHAYRPGQPTFADPELSARWRSTRRAAIDHLLTLIAGSAWADKLVLRGSVALREWFGEQARDPGDLDFVVRPATIAFNGAEGLRLLDDVIAAVATNPGPGLQAGKVSRDKIWTYERVPGRRLVFPYDYDGLTGSVQLDFVYNEELPMEPERLPIGDAWLLTAGPELSLAWKLLWLESDSYPQGKDLYDAVLLAERTDISPALIRSVLAGGPDSEGFGPTPDSQAFGPTTVLGWNVDWQNFLDEYPGVSGDVESWKQRLALALERSYSG